MIGKAGACVLYCTIFISAPFIVIKGRKKFFRLQFFWRTFFTGLNRAEIDLNQVAPLKVRPIVTNGVRSLQKCTLDRRSEVVGFTQ